jgi:hypothetical protein
LIRVTTNTGTRRHPEDTARNPADDADRVTGHLASDGTCRIGNHDPHHPHHSCNRTTDGVSDHRQGPVLRM